MNTQHTFFIYLYTTSACHLCELAEQLLISTQPKETICMIEISDDDSLMMKYGEKIPVLHRSDTSAELYWPFTATQIAAFLDQ
jgi:hypothetical protein